jgi:hypothetical protein
MSLRKLIDGIDKTEYVVAVVCPDEDEFNNLINENPFNIETNNFKPTYVRWTQKKANDLSGLGLVAYTNMNYFLERKGFPSPGVEIMSNDSPEILKSPSQEYDKPFYGSLICINNGFLLALYNSRILNDTESPKDKFREISTHYDVGHNKWRDNENLKFMFSSDLSTLIPATCTYMQWMLNTASRANIDHVINIHKELYDIEEKDFNLPFVLIQPDYGHIINSLIKEQPDLWE